jgi:hypothetical protein
MYEVSEPSLPYLAGLHDLMIAEGESVTANSKSKEKKPTIC